jgi:cytoplasmic iron level regulating protein YaaA (DUF328/UPF0246 family)
MTYNDALAEYKHELGRALEAYGLNLSYFLADEIEEVFKERWHPADAAAEFAAQVACELGEGFH